MLENLEKMGYKENLSMGVGKKTIRRKDIS